MSNKNKKGGGREGKGEMLKKRKPWLNKEMRRWRQKGGCRERTGVDKGQEMKMKSSRRKEGGRENVALVLCKHISPSGLPVQTKLN